jgi:hypothetical protein
LELFGRNEVPEVQINAIYRDSGWAGIKARAERKSLSPSDILHRLGCRFKRFVRNFVCDNLFFGILTFIETSGHTVLLFAARCARFSTRAPLFLK